MPPNSVAFSAQRNSLDYCLSAGSAASGGRAAAGLTESSSTSKFRVAFGGLFDVNGNWNDPHREHRLGVVGDLRLVPVANQAALRKMLIDVGIVGPLLVHGPPAPHWHVREYNSHE